MRKVWLLSMALCLGIILPGCYDDYLTVQHLAAIEAVLILFFLVNVVFIFVLMMRLHDMHETLKGMRKEMQNKQPPASAMPPPPPPPPPPAG